MFLINIGMLMISEELCHIEYWSMMQKILRYTFKGL